MNRLLGGVILLLFGLMLSAESAGILGSFGGLGIVNAKLGMVAGPVAAFFGVVQIIRGLMPKPDKGKPKRR